MLGGSKTTVTRRFPQLGYMRRDSGRESGKFGPRVQTSVSSGSNQTLGTRQAMSQKGGGCVKTSARFHTSLFRSLLRGIRAFRAEKIAKSLALLDRLQNFAEFLHGLGGKPSLCT